jgi:hypothetical protein
MATPVLALIGFEELREIIHEACVKRIDLLLCRMRGEPYTNKPPRANISKFH